MSDAFQQLLYADEHLHRQRAEYEAAAAKLEIAKMKRNIAYLLSQHSPVHESGVDREHLRALLGFISHGDVKRVIAHLSVAS